MNKDSVFGIKQDDLEKYTEKLKSGELDGYLSESGLSPEVIKLINEIVSDNDGKIYEAIIEKIPPSLRENLGSEELNSEETKRKLTEYEDKCRGRIWGYKNTDECKELLKDIRMEQIRANYGRLLNNYYMTLAQYLVQCRDFETSDDGLIPLDYDKKKQELETKMEEFQKNNCGAPRWGVETERCAGIIKEKERLEKDLGFSGLRNLWDDFVGEEHTPKDSKGNPINPEELKIIYENIQSFAPLVFREKYLPEETGEYRDIRLNLIKRNSGKCFKSDRLSNLTMVIESRYELDKFIKELGSFGKLLFLTLESGLFGRVEAELKKLRSSGASHSGGGNKRKSRKRKTKKKKSKKSLTKKRTRKYKKKNNLDMKRKKGGSNIRTRFMDWVKGWGWWTRFGVAFAITAVLLSVILLPHVIAFAAAAKASSATALATAKAAAGKAVAAKAAAAHATNAASAAVATNAATGLSHSAAHAAGAHGASMLAATNAAALVTTVEKSISTVSVVIASIVASVTGRAPAPETLVATDFGAPPMSSDQVVLDDGYPSLFNCPITSELMTDPVIDPEGNSYERVAIEKWLERNKTSPVTRTPLESHQLAPNRALKDAIVNAVNSKQQAGLGNDAAAVEQ